MSPPAAAHSFLSANGWQGADIVPLAGDASFRRYFRVRQGARSAVLMDAPPAHEDLGPILNVAGHLLERGFAAPRPLAVDRGQGLLLLEDLGDDRMGPWLVANSEREHDTYAQAVDLLVRLVSRPAPADLPPYDAEAMAREADLFPRWYAPALGLEVDAAAFAAAWDTTWREVLQAVAQAPVLVLRDYHADNLMILSDREELGLLDFQDALAGHPAYDLVSLLQDARRDVAPALEEEMIDRFVKSAGIAEPARFRAHYEILGAQRNTKILGIFTRLWKRDGKPHYLPLQPRVWAYLERNLAHPALADVRDWFDSFVPPAARAAAWRETG
ncbi:MAG: aminoglycoside phosphotransferase family protein [Sphingosinicella sp.]